MRVIKIGGSLMTEVAELQRCLDVIFQQIPQKIVIIPGGGAFADVVRNLQTSWQFDQQSAHHMAILAMKQMAELIKSQQSLFAIAETINDVKTLLNHHAVVIWSPDIKELNLSGVEASWDVTSDSLAAWLASQLCAKELILIKSATIPPNYTLQQLQKIALIDKAFCQVSNDADYKITIINKHSFNEHTFL